MSESSEIAVALDQHVLTITIDRAAKKNALTLAMYDAMTAALQRARDDAAVRVIVLRGSGGHFTAGNDLMDFMQQPPSSNDSPVGRFLDLLVTHPKPILAAVEGVAIGIGTTLLLHCDLVWAATGARLQLPFVPLGLSPEAGSSLLLAQRCGHVRAAELLLLGEPFGPERARELGLVNEVVEATALHDRVRERAAAIAALPPASVRATKALMRAPVLAALQTVMHSEAEVFFARLRSPEAAEAMSAFFGKRRPDFSRFE
ncbi:MAG: enoyl-CoA hydratase [Nannocystaceae bacterium]|nr:enoyl-CoA hydratase [Nannocystaceae bacterium]